jgi:hypothetical protein
VLEFNDLLVKAGIDPAKVLVMRHRPYEPKLRRVFAWIAAERPDLFKAYQASQFPRAEKALSRAQYLASFVGLTAGRALFVTLYEVGATKTITPDDFWAIPENSELHSLGMTGWPADDQPRSALWFDLRSIDAIEGFSGRLEIGWTGGERSWFRWAERNKFPIVAIYNSSGLEQDMPDWDLLVLRWSELGSLPPSWAGRIAEWRGIYLIVDESDGRGYVGSAYGTDNMLGRWLVYASTGHGGNRELRGRNPKNFRFSILQRVSPDMDPEDVIELENRWKIRLHTRELGLNKN